MEDTDKTLLPHHARSHFKTKERRNASRRNKSPVKLAWTDLPLKVTTFPTSGNFGKFCFIIIALKIPTMQDLVGGAIMAREHTQMTERFVEIFNIFQLRVWR